MSFKINTTFAQRSVLKTIAGSVNITQQTTPNFIIGTMGPTGPRGPANINGGGFDDGFNVALGYCELFGATGESSSLMSLATNSPLTLPEDSTIYKIVQSGSITGTGVNLQTTIAGFTFTHPISAIPTDFIESRVFTLNLPYSLISNTFSVTSDDTATGKIFYDIYYK